MCLNPHLKLGWGWHRETGLSPPVKYFTDRSKVVHVLWIFYVFSVLCLLCLCVRLFILPCGHLLGKGWLLGSRLWCLTVSLSLSHRYPESGVVLGCIDSWSLHPYLLWDKHHSLVIYNSYLPCDLSLTQKKMYSMVYIFHIVCSYSTSQWHSLPS